ncbi:MAG: phosphoglucosamine mutase [Bacteroidota bacterium]
MTLIKSISGIRGTIGNKPGENLTPVDLVRFSSAFGMWIKKRISVNQATIIVGRDARISGDMVNRIVIGTLNSLGINVIDAGLATTPTVEMAVIEEKADGGIILTASHNPKNWNALKLLNSNGEFVSEQDGAEILEIADSENFIFSDVENIGKTSYKDFLEIHLKRIINIELVNVNAISDADFSIAIDCVNSVGGIAIPKLLKLLGVKKVKELYCSPNGIFPHNPEPLPENLTEISNLILKGKYDLGFVVDPDVDRLAIICEDGSMFGEEYTLVAVSDYVLKNRKGNTVSNMSSTKALRDITENYGGQHFSSAVGEVNVVMKMKEVDAVIGGEGNGGVIFPDLHYGRDALIGIALFLSHLAQEKIKCSALRKKYPDYFMIKNKIELTPEINVDKILSSIATKYANYDVSREDGVKITFSDSWVHFRKSNTEPIIRIYCEAKSMNEAEKLAKIFIDEIKSLCK